jgi:hypothetical protein
MDFRIEPGLPPYGPPAVSFPRADAFREGLVVSFRTTSGERWTGNFARGFGKLNSVSDELGPKAAVVVSNGAAYLVDVDAKCATEITEPVEYIEYVPSQRMIVVGNGLWFSALGASANVVWRTRRISWDGMRCIRRTGEAIFGEAFTPMGPPDWLPFEVDLQSGHVEGGSFNGPT